MLHHSFLRLLIACSFLGCSSFASAQQSPCSNPVFRAFDFWIGHWQVGNDTSTVGYNRVEVILDSCVLLENWRGTSPSRGKSFNH